MAYRRSKENKNQSIEISEDNREITAITEVNKHKNNEVINYKSSQDFDDILECNLEQFVTPDKKYKLHKSDTREKLNIQESNEKEINKYRTSELLLERSYYCFEYCWHFTYSTFKFCIRVSGVYLLWIALHYVASHLYIKLCVPNNWYGFIISPFLTATPHCKGLRWIVYNGADMINNMWLIIGSWICSNLFLLNREMEGDK